MTDAHDVADVLGPVRDQGARGTCLAFAVTAAHEQARRRLRGSDEGDLGEEILYWLCKQIDGDGRSGTYPRSVAGALSQTGQSAAALWPYDPDRDESSASYAPPAAALVAASMRRANIRDVPIDLGMLRTTIRADQVLVLGLELWDGFFADHGGTLTEPSSGEFLGEGHAVVVVGFDDNTGELLLRNSWGPTWGDRGHGRLPYSALQKAARGLWVVEDDIDP